MSTAAQISANQLNAELSSGPVTVEGKSRSAQNSLQHGLATGRILIDGENPADYDAFVAGLLDDHHPQGVTETILVHGMATHHWLKLRAITLLAKAMNDPEAPPSKASLFMRYQAANERSFWKCFETLRKLQKQRLEVEIGFVPQKAGAPVFIVPPVLPDPVLSPEPVWKKRTNSLPPKLKRRRY